MPADVLPPPQDEAALSVIRGDPPTPWHLQGKDEGSEPPALQSPSPKKQKASMKLTEAQAPTGLSQSTGRDNQYSQ